MCRVQVGSTYQDACLCAKSCGPSATCKISEGGQWVAMLVPDSACEEVVVEDPPYCHFWSCQVAWIIGGTIGGVALLCLVAVAAFFYHSRSTSDKEAIPSRPASPGGAAVVWPMGSSEQVLRAGEVPGAVAEAEMGWADIEQRGGAGIEEATNFEAGTNIEASLLPPSPGFAIGKNLLETRPRPALAPQAPPRSNPPGAVNTTPGTDAAHGFFPGWQAGQAGNGAQIPPHRSQQYLTPAAQGLQSGQTFYPPNTGFDA
mmetsp:Transcript_8110/g.19791  ORF Transcript_8110/g.19791 Transcript_8110/m.19791 type:complete len:258 (-) Transcript_8110:170-943(-)